MVEVGEGMPGGDGLWCLVHSQGATAMSLQRAPWKGSHFTFLQNSGPSEDQTLDVAVFSPLGRRRKEEEETRRTRFSPTGPALCSKQLRPMLGREESHHFPLD